MILLFDAANTLIYKPSFYVKFKEVLKQHGFDVEANILHRVHKTISECFHFPDRTSREFYSEFNREVLYGLGIVPNQVMLEDLFNACSYLPWEKFEDTKYISQIPVRKAVLSNFHNGLNEIIGSLLGSEFAELIISENEKLRKPDVRFYEKAIDKLSVKPQEIVYIGDSVKLDLEPALKVGMNAWLIDRYNYYPGCQKRIQSLEDIHNIYEIENH